MVKRERDGPRDWELDVGRRVGGHGKVDDSTPLERNSLRWSGERETGRPERAAGNSTSVVAWAATAR
jgi:hypothetical protein